MDAFQEHCRCVGQVNPSDCGLYTGTQFLTDGIILVLECSVQAVQERSDPDERASLVFYLLLDPQRHLGDFGWRPIFSLAQSRLVRQALELLFAKYSEAVAKQGTKVRK